MEAVYDLIAQPPLAYVILFAIAAGDAVIPAFPSESVAILAGVLAALESDLLLSGVVAAAATGAFIGDSVSYSLGRFGGRRAQRRFFDGPYGRRGVRWACGQLRRRGALILVVARFVPGGRTGATFTSGLTAFPYPRYALFTAVAALLWAVYAVFLGYFGGRVFHERPLLAVGVAFALAAALFVAITVARRILASRARAPRGTEDARC